MNQNLYVMIPDESTVQQAKEKLAALGNEVEGVEADAAASGDIAVEEEPAA